ncbi:glycosyltransferase family 4 protein [Pseudovibrio sp. Tun.PSC04-5.I4]|uniref:glycosyltransferase family 4 protein n=1 Tax=Pseudovibrio sp. Tun.PSC04-5.I4 TaxID=1798213 RepID=UPI00088E5206|nr:glycosyltransferase family 4 protein [Pseudovibrio sp. Tun.PSC04-5.I4]SDR37807.1 Glycosyltransferase involved in cell wall bisynthesis [Pseudovibrio sp. Tun.PSC04-5.I4]
MKINFVTSKNMNSKIFADIFRRFSNHPSFDILVSETAKQHWNIYHYHRPQYEKRLKFPSVATVHHDLHDNDPFLSIEKFEPRYREASRVICLNSVQANQLHALGIQHTAIIPHGYDQNLFQKRPLKRYSRNRKVKFGVVSKRYDRRIKGEALLYELSQVLSPHQVEFVLVGEGRSLDAAMLEPIGFSCTTFEALPYRLFPQVYEEIDFLLILSSAEGGPANLPEALASGTPVITTPIGMAHDLITPNINGLFLTGNAKEDARIFDQLLSNHDDIFDQLMTGAHEDQSAITWEEVLGRHQKIYTDILERKPLSETRQELVTA